MTVMSNKYSFNIHLNLLTMKEKTYTIQGTSSYFPFLCIYTPIKALLTKNKTVQGPYLNRTTSLSTGQTSMCIQLYEEQKWKKEL